MKRWSIVAGLIALFALFVVALAGCGPTTDGLENAAGSGDGPGSGNWKPAKPENLREARRLHLVLQTLAENANEESANYDAIYPKCLDKEGKLLEGQDESCVKPLVDSAEKLDRLFTDFFTGGRVYYGWAQENGEEDPPDPPNPPDPPKEDPPETEDPGGDDDPWGCPPYCCLTCVHNIDVEYVFFPRPFTVEIPSS